MNEYPNRPKDALDEAMYADYLDGLTLTQVAKKHGSAIGNVSRLFKRRGWRVRPRGLFNPDRFWSKVSADGNGSYEECWLWTAHRNDRGYGTFTIGGGRDAPSPAHRVSYELMVGEIHDGLQIDHLCRNRSCVNPWHLEPVTARVNVERSTAGATARERQQAKTHCPQGHEYTEVNTRVEPSDYGGFRRVCRACHRDRTRARRAKERLQNA